MRKLTCSIFMFSNIFLTCIKMSKDSSAKYYQNNKERRQKKFVKDIKVFLKKKRRKIQQYGLTKKSQLGLKKLFQ